MEEQLRTLDLLLLNRHRHADPKHDLLHHHVQPGHLQGSGPGRRPVHYQHEGNSPSRQTRGHMTRELRRWTGRPGRMGGTPSPWLRSVGGSTPPDIGCVQAGGKLTVDRGTVLSRRTKPIICTCPVHLCLIIDIGILISSDTKPRSTSHQIVVGPAFQGLEIIVLFIIIF